MTQNPYASRVVDIYDDQKITTHGLYSLVRHPMYSATLLKDLYLTRGKGLFILNARIFHVLIENSSIAEG